MTRQRPETGVTTAIASEPFNTSALDLDRRDSKIQKLKDTRQNLASIAGPSTIEYEVERIRDVIRGKALDEDFSTAVRERWQTWSRNANPFRSDLGSSAASELKGADDSASESDAPSEDSAAEDPDNQGADDLPQKNKRKRTGRTKSDKRQDGSREVNIIEEWEGIRTQREVLLKDMDAVLPSAFRFTERQLKVYANRLKSKYINSLDRPFESTDIHRLLHHAPPRNKPTAARASEAGSSSSTVVGSSSAPLVFTISFFSSNIDGSREDAAAKRDADPSTTNDDTDGDNARDEYVKRICGDGLGGMKRAQTVRLLSNQTLSDLQTSLCCWSDELPERFGWRSRLQRHEQRRILSGSTHHFPVSGVGVEESTDVRLARYTGKRRQTDTALIIEDKLYTKGVHHGESSHEVDYATLFDQWKQSTGNTDAKVGWSERGGNLDLRLDQISALRAGQPYWLLHQGDCVHCFVIEQVRALRPSEQRALRKNAAGVNVESAPKGTEFVPFPRVTWLSTPAMLRFAADHNHNYGLGHHILRWEGTLPPSQPSQLREHVAPEASGSKQGDATPQTSWQIANLRTRRKDEGLLRKKQGKCLACSLRKAQVGILGGDSVRLPLAPTDPDKDDGTQDTPAIDGLDDHLTSICTPCAAILGLPTKSTSTGTSAELDWDQIAAMDHRTGWTVFPLY
ncbi:hypothetical protein PHSY_004294 [Pseudozyma hubeiensis SY62]|uniref:Uncharacterized protein n=1 Tax=Pseudozyma hubeiensis (strain SY62) TaxID=1305764 RepID=R9PF38_PSEHS|nr:hypothetical protein PHSY_004294 [Pseudozyma hubeiensis SY62]GAC96710.1 hypothetical protein PHSY_004294 [Pseudozyma hubeiensis SY62]